MLKLYEYQPSGNCYKIRLLLSYLNIEYESINIDILKQETQTPEFLKLNPDGRVPVLVDGDNVLAESNAILWYLADGTSYIPADKFQQAKVLQWMSFEQSSIVTNIAKSRFFISILKSEDKYKEKLKELKVLGYEALDIMEERLTLNDYFVGNQYTIADISLYAYTHMAEEGKFDLSKYHNINKWLSRVKNQKNHIAIL